MSVLEVPSLVDAVQQAMRARILDGKIAPGSAVTEILVASEFSVARTTAKAAVERLVNDGLLRRAANKSARVPILDPDQVRDVYFSRGLLESGVVQRLAEAGRVPAAAGQALEQFDVAVQRNQMSEVVASDIAFHRALVDALDSARLSRIYSTLMGEAQLCMAQMQHLRLLDPALIAQEHRAIVAAIDGRDPARAAATIQAHLHNAGDRIIAALEPNESPD